MAVILRSIGQGLRIVGPLTKLNLLQDPSFDLSVMTYWSGLNAVISQVSNVAKFGTTSLNVNVNDINSVNLYGAEQDNIFGLMSGSAYTLSGWAYLPVTLPTPLVATITYYDSSSNVISTVTPQLLATTTSLNQWVQFSYNFTAPDAVDHCSVVIGMQFNSHTYYTGGGTNPYHFNLDGMMLAPGTNNTIYVDGNYSGCVWSNGLYTQTLQTGIPTDLNFFDVGASIPAPTPVIT